MADIWWKLTLSGLNFSSSQAPALNNSGLEGGKAADKAGSWQLELQAFRAMGINLEPRLWLVFYECFIYSWNSWQM